MSSRHNFLDADNSIMERNLRFVQNDLEDNLNQYFGGSGSRGNNPAISAPPRDYKVVQPKAVLNRQPAFWKQQPQPPNKSSPEPQRNLTIKEQRKLENRLKFKERTKLMKQNKKQKKKERRLERLRDPYKKPVIDHPIIQCGLKKPPPLLSKAKPKEYWSQWWPRYKYIDNSIPHISPEEESIIGLVQPKDSEFRKNLLLRLGINKILRNINLTEKNYAIRDTFKLFKYKKHLENPKFHDQLALFEMNRVRSTLGRLEDKQVLALLHQSLIARWHNSLDIVKRTKAGEMIKSKNAYNILNDPAFQYLVKESIQQLKEICKLDWPKFEDFYNSLDVTDEVIDLTTLGFCFNENYNENIKDSRDAESNDDEGEEYEDIDDDDDEDDNEDEDGNKKDFGNQNPIQMEENDTYIPAVMDDFLIPSIQNQPPFTTAFGTQKLPSKKSSSEPPRQLTFNEERQLKNRLKRQKRKQKKRDNKQKRSL